MEEGISNEVNLTGLAEKGYLRFSIKCDDTEANEEVHRAFKEFCKNECDNNYTAGLKMLLQSAQTDWKYEALFEAIQALKSDLESLKETKSSKIKELF